MPFDYGGSPLPIRDDLAAAHRACWQWIAAPGDWWTGAERVAIAAEVRAAPGCARCAEIRDALSPLAVQGEHDAATHLPAAAVDAAHRLVNDASRLSKTWLEKTLAGGLSDAHYVELLGVVVGVVSIDTFHRALGLAPEPLPAPLPGEPRRQRPAAAKPGMGFLPTLSQRDAATGYPGLYPDLPQVPNVMRAMSLVPDNVRMLQTLSAAHYVPHRMVANVGAETGRALTRPQIELIAGRVSALEECFY